MTQELMTYLSSVSFLLLGVFAGYWFNNINKKTEKTASVTQENLLLIKENSQRTNALKEANDKAELQLKNDMSKLATDMSNMSKTLTDIGIKTQKHDLEIENLKSENRFITERIRARNNGN